MLLLIPIKTKYLVKLQVVKNTIKKPPVNYRIVVYKRYGEQVMTANYVNNNNTDNDTAKNSKNRLYTYNIPFLNSSLTAILTIVLASLKNAVVGGGEAVWQTGSKMQSTGKSTQVPPTHLSYRLGNPGCSLKSWRQEAPDSAESSMNAFLDTSAFQRRYGSSKHQESALNLTVL